MRDSYAEIGCGKKDLVVNGSYSNEALSTVVAFGSIKARE